jgi:hypothetical protein
MLGTSSLKPPAFLFLICAGAQLGVDERLTHSLRPHLVVPLRTKRVLAVACGGSHTLAIVADGAPGRDPTVGPRAPGHASDSGGIGALFSWGSSFVGALGLGPVCVSWKPTPVLFPRPSDGHVVFVAAGLVSSAAITSQGDLFMWGDASNGRLGLPSTAASGPPGSFVSAPEPVVTPKPLKIFCVSNSGSEHHREQLLPTSVACGGTFTAFLGRLPRPSVDSASGDVILVTGALGFPCRVVNTPLAGSESTFGAVTVVLSPVPPDHVEGSGEGASGGTLSFPAIIHEPSLTVLGARPCVIALAAGQ